MQVPGQFTFIEKQEQNRSQFAHVLAALFGALHIPAKLRREDRRQHLLDFQILEQGVRGIKTLAFALVQFRHCSTRVRIRRPDRKRKFFIGSDAHEQEPDRIRDRQAHSRQGFRGLFLGGGIDAGATIVPEDISNLIMATV